MANKSRVTMDKRLVVHVPVELAERIAGCARSKMTTASEFTRQALLAALAEPSVTPPPKQHHKQQQLAQGETP
jgi:hypothetical protein